MVGQATCIVVGPQAEPTLSLSATADPRADGPAKALSPSQRQDLAVQILAGTPSVSELARQHQVSRKFLYQQADTAQQALGPAFDPPPQSQKVLFYLPVTKAWLHQLILALVLIGRCSYRGVIALLRDLLDCHCSLGTVHNVVHAAVAKAQVLNGQYELAGVRIAAHDEIFQADQPVLVGVDTASTFCYLLSLEAHRDAETWAIRLLELGDRGFAPEVVIADGGSALRAGQELALPGVPCWGDLFHLCKDATAVVRFLENRAYRALAACEELQRQRDQRRWRGLSTGSVSRQRHLRQVECDAAIRLHDEVELLLSWLCDDVLAVAGPSYPDRCALYDFVLAELRARVPQCPHRLQPLYRLLQNQREEFLAFAHRLDEQLDLLAAELEVAPEQCRRMLVAWSRDLRDARRYREEAALRAELRGRFFAIQHRVASVAESTVRASSLVENVNSQLRTYFFLRRHLGNDYLALLQFYLNHRVLERSDRPHRRGKTPAALLTGQEHPHWLELLGYTRFQRN
jgi:hypothetical protein